MLNSLSAFALNAGAAFASILAPTAHARAQASRKPASSPLSRSATGAAPQGLEDPATARLLDNVDLAPPADYLARFQGDTAPGNAAEGLPHSTAESDPAGEADALPDDVALGWDGSDYPEEAAAEAADKADKAAPLPIDAPFEDVPFTVISGFDPAQDVIALQYIPETDAHGQALAPVLELRPAAEGTEIWLNGEHRGVVGGGDTLAAADILLLEVVAEDMAEG